MAINEEQESNHENNEFETESQESDLETSDNNSASSENAAKHKTSEGNTLVFDESSIEDAKFMQAARDVVNNTYYQSHDKSSKDKDHKFSCPKCDKEIKSAHYGKLTCPHCKHPFVRINREIEKDIIKYKTLFPEEVKKYDKILAQINNNLEEMNYSVALELCKKAEEIGPGEVATWVYFALVEFLVEIKKKDPKVRKPTAAIIKKVKSHIEKCKIHGMTKEECRPLEKDIAKRLFEIEKSRINSVQAQYLDSTGNPKWSKYNFIYLQTLLDSFDICYTLDNDSDFLEAYVDEIKKDYKWIFKKENGELISNPTCAQFNPVKKINFLVNKIQIIKSNYKFPVIAEERFVVNKCSYLKINSVTVK